MNVVGVGAAFCMGCCPNIRNGAAIAVPAVWVSPPMSRPYTCLSWWIGATENAGLENNG